MFESTKLVRSINLSWPDNIPVEISNVINKYLDEEMEKVGKAAGWDLEDIDLDSLNISIEFTAIFYD